MENSRRRRPPIAFGHLCVIAREQITNDPEIDNAEWKARIKDRLVALGFTYPTELDAIDRALKAVERALAKEGRTRPGPAPAYRPPQPDARLERPITHDEARRFLAAIGAKIKTIASVPSLTPHDAARHRASAIVAREIVESIARCEAAERAIVDEAPK